MLTVFASPLIPLAGLLALAIYMRLTEGIWLAPGAFAALIWSGFTIAALFMAPEYRVSGFAIWVILLLILAIQIGATLGEGRSKKHFSVSTSGKLPVRRWLFWVALFSVLATTGAIIFGVGIFGENDLPFSFLGLLAIGHLASAARYGGVQETAIVRVLWTWVYPAALLGGITFVLAKRRWEKCASLAAFVPAITFSFVEATRAGVLIALCCWLGGFFSTKVFESGGRFNLFNRRTLILGGIFATAIAGANLAVDAIRVFTPEQEFIVQADSARLKSTFVGSLSVFSSWIRNEQSTAPITYGSLTFAGLFDISGLHVRQQGSYGDSQPLAEGEESNIYTAFRGLIQDFTFPGAFGVCVALGWMAGSAFAKTKRGNAVRAVHLAAFYTLLLFSPIIALTAQNGPVLAWLVVSVIVALATRTGGVPVNRTGIRATAELA